MHNYIDFCQLKIRCRANFYYYFIKFLFPTHKNVAKHTLDWYYMPTFLPNKLLILCSSSYIYLCNLCLYICIYVSYLYYIINITMIFIFNYKFQIRCANGWFKLRAMTTKKLTPKNPYGCIHWFLFENKAGKMSEYCYVC